MYLCLFCHLYSLPLRVPLVSAPFSQRKARDGLAGWPTLQTGPLSTYTRILSITTAFTRSRAINHRFSTSARRTTFCAAGDCPLIP